MRPLTFRLTALALLAASPATSHADPTVAVTTVAATQGSLPDIVTAYGVVTPSGYATRTINVAVSGRVSRILAGPGAAVKQGDALIEWAQSDATRQSWEQAQTALKLAQAQRDHTATLLDRHLATRDQLDQAEKALADARATVAGLRATGADQAVRVLRAPEDGVVVTVAAAPGDYVAAGSALATLAPRHDIVLTVGVEPVQAGRLKTDDPAQIAPLDGGSTLTARIARIDARLDPQTRLVPVDLSLAQTTSGLMPGQSASAQITAGTVSGWQVPHAAVLEDADGTYLFQVNGDQAALVRVHVVATQGDTDLADGKLIAARRIVVDGNSQLADGTKLREAKQ